MTWRMVAAAASRSSVKFIGVGWTVSEPVSIWEISTTLEIKRMSMSPCWTILSTAVAQRGSDRTEQLFCNQVGVTIHDEQRTAQFMRHR